MYGVADGPGVSSVPPTPRTRVQFRPVARGFVTYPMDNSANIPNITSQSFRYLNRILRTNIVWQITYANSKVQTDRVDIALKWDNMLLINLKFVAHLVIL